MGIDFVIDDYPLYGICALMDGMTDILSPKALRIIQLLRPDLEPDAIRFSGIPADLSGTYQYRPLGRKTKEILFIRYLPKSLQDVVIVDGRVLKKTARHDAVRKRLHEVACQQSKRLWIVYDDRDFGQILNEIFLYGIPFRLYLKREKINPRAHWVLQRRHIEFMYSSYAVCKEHFENAYKPEQRSGVFFCGETEAPFYEARKAFIRALRDHPVIADHLVIPEQRQSVSDYLRMLQSSLIGLDLPAGGMITPRRYEIPASGAALVTVNKVTWLPDDPCLEGKAIQTRRLVEDLCRTVERLLADQERCRCLSQDGRDWVLRHHTTSKRAAALLQKLEGMGVDIRGL